MEATIDAVVTGTTCISPGFVRVGFTVRDGGAWSSLGVPDEFVHVEVGARTPDADGHSARHYTVSGVVPGGFEIEVALHGHGPGAKWGETVAAGDAVRVSPPKGYYAAPDTHVPRVLVGDATALPAIARILAEASTEENFRVTVELATMADRRDLPTAASADVRWCLGGNGVATSTVVDAAAREVAAALEAPRAERRRREAPSVYAWVACEAAVSRRVRTRLRHGLGLPARAVRIVGYWHSDARRMRAVWDGLTQAQRDTYSSMWREDRSDEENWDEVEPFLRGLGL